jgi:hypothetical protein
LRLCGETSAEGRGVGEAGKNFQLEAGSLPICKYINSKDEKVGGGGKES